MKIASAWLAILLLGSCNSASSEIDFWDVYYVGFGVDTITGYHRENFPEAGCKAQIEKSSFLRMMRPNDTKLSFNHKDIKALVVGDDQRYFIDSYGVVERHDGGSSIVKREVFSESIIYSDSCD